MKRLTALAIVALLTFLVFSRLSSNLQTISDRHIAQIERATADNAP